MSISDEEFEELLRGMRTNPDSNIIAAALDAAADTKLRKALVKALTGAAVSSAPQSEMAGSECRSSEQRSEGQGSADSSRRHEAISKVVRLPVKRDGLGPDATCLSLKDVGGLEQVKVQLHRKLLHPLSHPGLFQKFKRRSGGGILLYGPPGCGKTMVVKAVANEADVRLIKVEAAEILDSSVGISEKKIAAAFREARMGKPSILFFDEVEALAGRRSTGSDFKAGLVSSFLTAFDGLADQSEGILVLAATNMPWAVDNAFRRPGRFDRTLFVPPPDRAARQTILRALLDQRPVAGEVDVATLAAATQGFSGADLLNLVETAIDTAIQECLNAEGDEQLKMGHLLAALDEVSPTTLEWLATARNYAKYGTGSEAYKEVLTFLDRNAA